MISGFPLQWPQGYTRTEQRKFSRFKISLASARDFVKEEVRRMHGEDLVISTNIPLNQNGDLRADYGRYKQNDPGVAVYFKYNGKDVCLCADSFRDVEDNLYAIGRTIEALRQISRDGVSDFLDRTFTGFVGLPEKASGEAWYNVLGLAYDSTAEELKSAYRRLVKQLHPDKPDGDRERYDRIQEAYQEGLKHVKY